MLTLLRYISLKNNHLHVIMFALLSSALVGCSTTTKIQYLEPAEIDDVSLLKKIAVDDFKKDSVGLAGKIETKLSQKKFNNQPYFTVVSRQNLDRILSEQKRQYSGLTNEQNNVELGELIGAQAFISGKINSKSYADNRYTEERTRCVDEKCKKIQTYRVQCKKRNIQLSANIKIVNIETSKVVYTETYQQSSDWRACTDNGKTLPNPSNVWQNQANNIARQFVEKISPSYTYREIELLEDPDISYTSEQKKLLSGAIEFIEAQRMDKADKLLSQLVFETESKSYVANYNLGVVKEAQGDYTQAQQLYNLADNLLMQPNEAIDKAVQRINKVISHHQKAQMQIGK